MLRRQKITLAKQLGVSKKKLMKIVKASKYTTEPINLEQVPVDPIKKKKHLLGQNRSTRRITLKAVQKRKTALRELYEKSMVVVRNGYVVARWSPKATDKRIDPKDKDFESRGRIYA
jgi:hypothetical protein